MRKRRRPRRNKPCPCGDVKKYKKCCWGKVDWAEINAADDPVKTIRHLSTRGKNMLFLERLAGALQLNRRRLPNIQEFKRAFTPKAVQEIYTAVGTMWYNGEELDRLLRREREATSGLYVGVYDPRRILQGITRHSLYTERILLVDPYMSPMFIREEFNPIVHPEQHRSTALRWAWLWLMMAPWIDADLVHFIRTPGEFDPTLQAKADNITKRRYQRIPTLKQRVDEEILRDPDLFNSIQRQVVLGMPDEYFRQLAIRRGLGVSEEEVKEVIEMIRATRANDPFVLEPAEAGSGELLQMSSGASYEMAKWTSELSGSHLITDIEARWAEIKADRQEAKVMDSVWTPFAKAFTGVPFPYLNQVPLDAALRLRKEERLRDLRSCLGKAWRACREDDEFAEGNVENLKLELEEQMRLADAEWMEIRASLAQMIGSEVAVGVGGSATILTGAADWVAAGIGAAGILAAGITGTVVKKLRSIGHSKKHPASFFLGLRKGKGKS